MIHPAFCRARWVKVSKKVMKYFSKRFSKHHPPRTFRKLPRSPVRSDPDRLAPFVDRKASKKTDLKKASLTYEIAQHYAKGESVTKIKDDLELHQEEVKRQIRKALKGFINYEDAKRSELEEAGETEIGLLDCPNVVKLPLPEGKRFLVRPSTVSDTLFKVYGSTFLGALRYEASRILVFEYLKESVDQGILHPAIINKSITKAILRSKPIGLFEFLKSEGATNKKEIRKDIQSIYDFTIRDLKQMISG